MSIDSLGMITLNNLKLFDVDTDPAAGLVAPKGSFALDETGAAYIKFGDADTEWNLLSIFKRSLGIVSFNTSTDKLVLGGTVASPSKLHVIGVNQSTLALDSPANPELRFEVTNTAMQQLAVVTSAGGYVSTSGANDFIFFNKADTNWLFATYNAGTPLERMRITTTGAVGIGTATPQGFVEIYKSQNATTQFLISNDNIGINAIAALTVTDTVEDGSITFTGINHAFPRTFTITTSCSGGMFIETTAADLIIAVGGSDRITVLTTGETGIGTGTPSEKLSVAGRVRSTNSDIAVENSARGVILKDTQVTPHYWRIQVSTLGVLTTADLGTSLPAE